MSEFSVSTGEAHPGTDHGYDGAYPIPGGPQIGDFKYSFLKTLAEALASNQGWVLCDGTHTLPDGSVPPDMRDRVAIGAGTTYSLGATGGSADQGALAHDHNHDGSAVSTNVATDTLASGSALTAPGGGVLVALTIGHSHTTNVTQPTAHSNHAAVTGGNLPPYGAPWPLLYMGGAV